MSLAVAAAAALEAPLAYNLSELGWSNAAVFILIKICSCVSVLIPVVVEWVDAPYSQESYCCAVAAHALTNMRFRAGLREAACQIWGRSAVKKAEKRRAAAWKDAYMQEIPIQQAADMHTSATGETALADDSPSGQNFKKVWKD